MGEEWKDDGQVEKALAAASMNSHAAEMKAAYDFFDEIGWLTPLDPFGG